MVGTSRACLGTKSRTEEVYSSRSTPPLHVLSIKNLLFAALKPVQRDPASDSDLCWSVSTGWEGGE